MRKLRVNDTNGAGVTQLDVQANSGVLVSDDAGVGLIGNQVYTKNIHRKPTIHIKKTPLVFDNNILGL